MVKQESRALQHSEATALSDSERLLGGSEDWTMSTKRFWKAASPICGVVVDVEPGGAQITNPSAQPPAASKEDTEPAIVLVARVARRRTFRRMLVLNVLNERSRGARRARGWQENKELV